jgi:hypothetical protein
MYKLTGAMFMALLGMSVTQAFGENRQFELVNESNRTIVQVQASNIGENYFNPIDLLGDEVVRPGESIMVEPDNPQGWCRFDLRITFRNGDRQDVGDVNMCAITALTTYGAEGDRGEYVRVSY